MGAGAPGALETLRDVAGNPAKVAREWKAGGGKIMGTRCLPVPEEIVWAAGMLPYPLYGTPEPVELADSYFQSCTCEFVRNLFDHALKGRLEFLDGLALANTCDVMRRLFDIWDRYVEKTPVYIINNPQKLLDEGNRDYTLEELRRFRSWAGEIAGAEVTDGKLRDAICLHNRTRSLLGELYSMRRADPPPLTGEEALDVAMAATVLPRHRANELLEALIAEVRDREPPDLDGPRILVTGSVLDDATLIRMIEQEGGVVVADDLCNTTRTFHDSVEEAGDPLEALYRFFNKRPLCACFHPAGARSDYLLGLAREYDVDAVVDFTLKYCHPFLYEAPLIKKRLEAEGVPTTVLEIGHDRSGHGQLRTRIQAFIEMVEA